MEKTIIDQMVDRFLCWQLPEDFAPDGGIKFTPPHLNDDKALHWPTGMCLLTAPQAKAMFEHCADGTAITDADEDAYVIDKLGRLLAEIAVIVNGPEPPLTRWSYHDLPEKVRALTAAAMANPCAGIKGKAERGRKDVYVHDDAFEAVWKHATPGLRDAMDLAYLTGQRPSDVVKLDETKIRDGTLELRQGKTGMPLRIEVQGELAAVIERIKARKRAAAVYTTRLVVDEDCRPLTLGRISDHFVRARAAAGIDPASFQFRDLRAKAGTDKADSSGDIRAAQTQLGHANVTMTEHYVRRRRGAKTTPTR